jgi:hypothetical protein
MTCAIRVVALADGRRCWMAGHYLSKFDFDAAAGRGRGWWTTRLGNALHFDDPGAAMAFWKTQSRTVPLRDDGKPNRPLTAFTVEIVPLPTEDNVK